MKNISKIILTMLAVMMISSNLQPAFAKSSSEDRITGKTVCAGVLSFLVWPGIGQAMNNNKSHKVVTHAVLGFLPPYRFWSGYDALVDRQTGYWKGRI